MTCKICKDKRVKKINDDILAGISRTVIAKKYDLVYKTLQRHDTNCVMAMGLAATIPIPVTVSRKKSRNILAPNNTEEIPIDQSVSADTAKGGLRTYERMEGLIETLEALLASLGSEDEDFYKKTTVIEELRRVLETSIKIYEAQCKIAAMFSKAEDVSASLVFRWLDENHPGVLAGLREYLGRRLV